MSYDILTKRYRCVWRKVRRINRFRAFSGPDFFFQTIDANRCFRASAPIRTGRFPVSCRCVQPAPFFSGDFSGWQRYFSQKNSQRFGRRFVGPDGLRKRRSFSFKKGTGLSACICRPEHDRSGLIFWLYVNSWGRDKTQIIGLCRRETLRHDFYV